LTVIDYNGDWPGAKKIYSISLSFPLLLIGRGISLKAVLRCCHYILMLVPLVTVCGNSSSNFVRKASSGFLMSEASLPRFSRTHGSMREPYPGTLSLTLRTSSLILGNLSLILGSLSLILGILSLYPREPEPYSGDLEPYSSDLKSYSSDLKSYSSDLEPYSAILLFTYNCAPPLTSTL
jgi:hypothetical protein